VLSFVRLLWPIILRPSVTNFACAHHPDDCIFKRLDRLTCLYLVVGKTFNGSGPPYTQRLSYPCTVRAQTMPASAVCLNETISSTFKGCPAGFITYRPGAMMRPCGVMVARLESTIAYGQILNITQRNTLGMYMKTHDLPTCPIS
jgi:hypothetical protein